MRLIVTFFLSIVFLHTHAQDTHFLKVHFLYGSKPATGYKDVEQKWFGGIHGGHVGIESDTNVILNFLPSGEFHWFENPNERHSHYVQDSNDGFYSMFGRDSVRKTIIYIPVSAEQKKQFDSIAQRYLSSTPYDYAFMGMRCGSAAYEILSQLQILPEYTHKRTYRKIFYPKKLRKQLFEKAEENTWKIIEEEGSVKRKWEKDL